jgi:hypothetical protein
VPAEIRPDQQALPVLSLVQRDVIWEALSEGSFDQDRIAHCTMRLAFLHGRPSWVRAYECPFDGKVRLLRALQPHEKSANVYEYGDASSDVAARSARVYFFPGSFRRATPRYRDRAGSCMSDPAIPP